ncbi:ABC transporter permease [Natrialba sp. INN-245]|uniref:ABC transporter permease n=1 Tax=Natrialba sp. INN-245 TaxID=2690967 RepID=UPI0013102B3C|nr:ABC transporter permease [Natrialba sp. INN-245]MWV39812.1 ABC transporter permease subunit [Natrialba sp. INN-245]
MSSETAPATADDRDRIGSIKHRLMENRRVGYLLSPGSGLLWVLFFLFLPLTIIVAFSFFRAGEFGTIIYEPTLENYQRFVEGSVYQRVILRSLLVGMATTLIVLPFGYTLGYFLGRTKSRWTPILLGLVVVQFWVPLVIRTYAWIPILGRQGIINDFLLWIGVISEPIVILYTTHGMLLGLAVSIMPFMVLPVYSIVSTIDEEVIQAAKTLGASDARAFWEVTFPLSWPGVVSGILFTFILSAGAYLAPELLGGTGDRLIAPVIETVFTSDFNWPFAATLSLIYVALIVGVLYLFSRKADLEEALEGTQL